MKGFLRASFERVQHFFSVVERVQQKASSLPSQKGV